MIFGEFFEAATEHAPYDYQRRLAGARRPDCANPGSSISQPASASPPPPSSPGSGTELKSAIRNADWPRRLVYCLPMRTLLEHTRLRGAIEQTGTPRWTH